MTFLEAIGALTLVGGVFYFLLRHLDSQDKEIEFFRWILDNDSTAREEFTQKYSRFKFGVSDYEYNKALREFFTEEKLEEINRRFEEKKRVHLKMMYPLVHIIYSFKAVWD